ncbi:hypothetical protein [Terriglobus roseus]|uniref:KTSC domain-containing protein n=1 Tax=Terriglobus roseus TaxID=392734 RepID=A0A1H4JEF0_9BACT|nr:hypothetical protein [Terriglobus roseus]SEB44690.1 hypothetical protein SAMN05443244_0566 [Terriglobus roseus]
MVQAVSRVKIASVNHTENAIVVVFDDGKEFIYPAAILYSAIPTDDAVARRVKETLSRRTNTSTEYVQ